MCALLGIHVCACVLNLSSCLLPYILTQYGIDFSLSGYLSPLESAWLSFAHWPCECPRPVLQAALAPLMSSSPHVGGRQWPSPGTPWGLWVRFFPKSVTSHSPLLVSHSFLHWSPHPWGEKALYPFAPLYLQTPTLISLKTEWRWAGDDCGGEACCIFGDQSSSRRLVNQLRT